MEDAQAEYAQLTLRTSVRNQLKRFFVFRGTILGAMGAMLLLLGVIFFPAPQLSYFGGPLFILAGGLMTWGLLPYRKLCRLELSPFELTLMDDEVRYYSKKEHILSIAVKDIRVISYVDRKRHYGITLKLQCGKNHFFPYFTERSYSLLKARLNNVVHFD